MLWRTTLRLGGTQSHHIILYCTMTLCTYYAMVHRRVSKPPSPQAGDIMIHFANNVPTRTSIVRFPNGCNQMRMGAEACVVTWCGPSREPPSGPTRAADTLEAKRKTHTKTRRKVIHAHKTMFRYLRYVRYRLYYVDEQMHSFYVSK